MLADIANFQIKREIESLNIVRQELFWKKGSTVAFII